MCAVSVSNLLGAEGDGFIMAQARLGPGRVHHCMRSIGMAELALELMVERAQERKTFGCYLHQHGSVSEWIARLRMDIEQARMELRDSEGKREHTAAYLTPPARS